MTVCVEIPVFTRIYAVLLDYLCLMQSTEKELIDVQEFAELFGLKPSYIYKLIYEKKINYYKPFGKKVYFRRSELLERFNDSKVEANADEMELKNKADLYFFNR